MESTATTTPMTTPMPPSASLDMVDGEPSGNGHGDMAVLTLVHKDKLTWTGSVYRPGESAANNDTPGVFKFTKPIPASVPRWAYDKLIGRQEDLFGTGMQVPLFCAGEPPAEMFDDLPESDQVGLLHDRVAGLSASVERTVQLVEQLAQGKAAEGTLTIDGAADPLAGINERMDGLEAQNERVARALETLAAQRAPAKPKKKRKARKKKAAKAKVTAVNADVPCDTSTVTMGAASAQETAADAADPAE